jgi:hypothetical protein
LAWSLRFVRDFADDILRAAAEAAPLHAAGQRARGLHLRKSALPGLLAQCEAEGRPLPGYGGKVNLTFLARKLACPQRCIVRARPLINATAAICRHELLDRTLIWNQRHLLHSLREFEHFYNEHRPHRTLRAAAPLRPLPEPITDPERIAHLDVRRRDRLGGTLHEYRNAA